MKVTVCFGSVRVLVPCGAGDLLVRDLVREAILRYKKATGQGPETWVGVRTLRASSGGILDPDDRVRDVADDRETLTAECTAQAPQPRAAQADGASGSSAGTASPDMFRGGGGSLRVPVTDSCVEVGAADLEEGRTGLQVRRGSEPSLHQDTSPPHRPASDQTKRWSAAVVCRDDLAAKPEPRPPDPAHFQRQTNRLSMQFSGPGSGVWLDAADRVQSYGSKSLPRDARRDPLGQDTPINGHRVEDMLRWVSGVNDNVASVRPIQERPLDLLPEVGNSERAISGMEVPVSPSAVKQSGAVVTIPVALVKGEKGLGFTITTRDNPTGGHCPIYIKNILPKGAAVTDGRLRAGDRLVSVTGVGVAGLNQQQVVALLRNTPTDSTVHIVVERPAPAPYPTQRVEPQQSPTKYTEKSIGGTPVNGNIKPDIKTENGRVSSIVNALNQGTTNNSVKGRIPKSSSKDELTKKHSSTDSLLQDALNQSSNSNLSVRNRLILRLDVPVNETEKAGLGISVKGKVTVGPEPHDLGIFIKSVLHGGAASRDGRLHTNDQLLCVNGVSLVGQSNAEAMETLRRALLHSRPNVRGSISLAIARRTDSIDTIARWKDDTPPNGNESANSNDNSQNYNTVIYNSHSNDKESKSTENFNQYEAKQGRGLDSHDGKTKKHSSIVTINNNTSWVSPTQSNQSDDSKGYLERDKDPPHDPKRDSTEILLGRWNPVIDRLTRFRNESYYIATQVEAPVANGHGQGHHFRPNVGHVHMARSQAPHHNVIIEEDYGTTTARGSISGGNGTESGSESGTGGFSRDAVGRRSMSEKKHAAMDAKQTDTYRRIKEIKATSAVQVGPSLGMRKSSSLESLQTAIQENQRNPRNEPIYARAHPPLKHWLTDDGPAAMVRGSPQQSSLSHKKPSLLKSLSTMFSTMRMGKPNKKTETELYGRTTPGRSSEKSLSREAIDKRDRDERPNDNSPPNHRLEASHSRQSSGERHKPERDRRAHAHAPPYRPPPTRLTPPAATVQAMDSTWGASGHYANYDEIQQNLNGRLYSSARREKLSEVQIGQMRQQVTAQRAKAVEESRRAVGGYHSQRSCRDREAPRPQSNYYEYETAPPRRPGKLSHYQ